MYKMATSQFVFWDVDLQSSFNLQPAQVFSVVMHSPYVLIKLLSNMWSVFGFVDSFLEWYKKKLLVMIVEEI